MVNIVLSLVGLSPRMTLRVKKVTMLNRFRLNLYYSSYQMASVSRWHAHISVVVFHTLHRVQRDTRLFPLISYKSIRCNLTFDPPREYSFTSLSHSSPPSPSVVAASAYCYPSRSMPTCYHHCIPTCYPKSLYETSHSSNSDCVAIYCATVFWRRLIYSSIVKNPASYLAAAAEVYLHLPSVVICVSRPVSFLDTWV